MEQSAFGRILSVLVSPTKTFEAIARRPTWVVIMVVMVLAIGVHEYFKAQRTDVEGMIRARLAEQGQLSEAQVEQQVRIALAVGKYQPIILAVFVPAMTFLFALIGWVALKVMGSEIGFISTLSTQLHGGVPTLLLMLFSLLVLLGRSEVGGDDIIRGVLMSNAAFLVPEDGSKALKGFLAAIDIFVLWSVWLTAQGYRIVGRVSGAVAWTISVGAWILGALFRAAGAAFS